MRMQHLSGLVLIVFGVVQLAWELSAAKLH